MKNNMEEVSRKSMINRLDGNYGVGVTAIDAEIVVRDNGKVVYLHAQWVDAVDEISYDATEKSVYDIYEKLNENKVNDELLLAERDEIEKSNMVDFEKYRDLYADELEKMIYDEAKRHDVAICDMEE